MNMASFRIFIFSSVLVGTAFSGFVEVKCKAVTVGQYGQQVMLDCVIQLQQEAAGATIKNVNWKKEGEEELLLHFIKGEPMKTKPRYSFAEPSWNNTNMNVSLLINNAAVKDKGVYTCTVLTTRGGDTKDIPLKITAKYSRPTVKSTPEKITENSGAVLTCTSEGGYPEGLLRWFDMDNTDWTKSATMQTENIDGGLFRLTSSLDLLPGSIFSKYTCVVYSSNGDKEEEFPFEINMNQMRGQDKETNSASKIVAPVVVIGSLIVGLLILLVVRLRRNRQARRQSAIPLMDGAVPTCEHAVEENDQELDVESGDSDA